MNLRSKLRFSNPVAILLLVCLIGCFTFQGCEDSFEIDEAVLNYDRFISIPHLDNPETLMKSENTSDYLEAYKRFTHHVTINKGKMNWNINSGSDINISENLFKYIINYLNGINKEVDNGKLIVLEEDGEIKILRKTEFEILRLKSSGNESTPINSVNFGGSSQSIGEQIINAFNYFSNGSYSTEELFDLSSGNFSTTNMQSSGTFTMGGFTYSWGFTDITAGGCNNIPNGICITDTELYGQRTVHMLRYCQGNSAVQISSYSSDAESYLLNLIP